MYDTPASRERLDRAAAALKANGFTVLIAENGEEALKKALEILPEGAEVMTMSSVTCTQIGLYQAIDESGRYDSTRKRLMSMDRKTQNREMQRIGAAQADVLERGIVEHAQTAALLGQLPPAAQLTRHRQQAGAQARSGGVQRLSDGITFLTFHLFALPVGLAPVSRRA